MARKTYAAKVTREGRFWVAYVEDGDCATQEYRLDALAGSLREVIALLRKVPADSFDVILDFSPAPEVRALMEAERQLRAEAARIKAEAAEANRRVAWALRTRGYSVRDIGTVMGVSHQRAAQLLASSSG